MWLWSRDFFEKPESIKADKNEMDFKKYRYTGLSPFYLDFDSYIPNQITLLKWATPLARILKFCDCITENHGKCD